MSITAPNLRFVIVLLAVGALNALAAPVALGALTASPNPSATGSYTVSGSVAASRVYEWMTLIETAPDGATQSFGLSGPSNISLSFSGKAVGIWAYRVEGCYFEYLWAIQEVEERCEYVGASLSVTVQLPPADRFPGFADTPAASRAWKQNSAIAGFTFEAATGGDGTLSYAASGLPDGVTMSAARRISGTPTAAGSGTATVTATDEDGDEATKSFDWTVAADLVPGFGATALPARTWARNQAIVPFVFEAARGGDAPLSYAIAGLPAGVGMSTRSRRISGTPTAAGSGTATVTVTDTDGDTESKSFSWTVAAVSFGIAASPNPSGTGAYTVSGSVPTSQAHEWYQLLETAPDGTTRTLGIGGPLRFSASISGRSGGTYAYQAQGCGFEPHPVYQEVVEVCYNLGSPLSVEVDFRPGFSAGSAPARSWTQNEAIASFTFEAASGGDGTLSYTASGLPAGVTMSGGRVISGTPTEAGSGTATVTTTDADGDEATKSFSWTVAEDLVPTFGSMPIAAKSWKENEAIPAFTFEAATGGDAPLTYAARGLPAGVSMSSARRIAGTPTAAGSGTATVTATDEDGDTARKSFSWTVAPADRRPNFSSTTAPSRSWTANQAISSFTFEAATGGDGTLNYTVRGLPAGVTMSSARRISGTPTEVGSGTATVTATDEDGDTARKSFSWTVASADRRPSFGSASIGRRSWVAGEEIPAFAAPGATSGDAPLRYGARGLPAGVNLVKANDADTYSFSGTPTAAGSGTATLVVVDNDGDRATLSFVWTVTADSAPSFGTASVTSKTWTLGEAIASFTLPSATGGNGAISYGAAGLPAGVIVSPSLQVSGVPRSTGTGTATLTARDADGDTATLTFAWTVTSSDAPAGALLSVTPNPTTSPDFTVVGSYAGTREYIQLILTETGPRGHTAEFDVGGAFSQGFLFNQDIANRANGTYTYSLKGCYLKPLPELREAEEVCETVGDPLTVTVNGPAPDSVAAQLNDTWEARASVADGNGLKHLYLKRTSEAVGGGLLRDVILRQTSAGEFAVESAPPGSVNATEGAAWPLTTAVDVVQNDINLDGFVDILLRGLGKAVGAGAQDQMVYAPGRFPTVILNAVDDEVRNFLAEVDAWTQSPTYFQTRVIQYSEPIIRWRSHCLGGGDYPDLDNVCYSVPVIVGYRTVTVPTNLSAGARAFAGQFDVVDGQVDIDVTPGSSAAVTLSQTLTRVFGAEFFGDRLKTACTGSFPYDIDTDIPCDDARQVGRILLHHATNMNQLIEGYDPTASRAVTPVGRQRDLTQEETTLATKQGLDRIDLSRVRVEHVPEAIAKEDIPDVDDVLNSWYVLRAHPYTIFVPEHVEGTNDLTRFREDFSGDTGLASILIHELTHLHQYHDPEWRYDTKGGSFQRDGLRAYEYRRRAGELEHNDFWEYSYEEQAQILQDRFLLKNGIAPTFDCKSSPRPGIPCNQPSSLSIPEMYAELDGLTNIPEDAD